MKLGILIEWERIDGVEKLMAGLPEMTEEEQSDQVERLMGKARFFGRVIVNNEETLGFSPIFTSVDKAAEKEAEAYLMETFLEAIKSKLVKL